MSAWPGWTNTGSLLLTIAPACWAVPTTKFSLGGVVFVPKHELHVTLIGSAAGQVLQLTSGEPYRTAALRTAFEKLDWRFSRTGRLLRLQTMALADDRRVRCVDSIVELVQLPAIVPFYQTIGRLLGREIAIPPPHVTLYTAGRAKGIGVSSCAALRRLTLHPLATDALPCA